LRAYFRYIHPILRKRAGRERGLLANSRQKVIDNAQKYIIVHGATNQIGKIVSRVLAKHGYSLVLVDVSLDKL
jgi:predicted amino acid dehydrogenase